MLGAKGLGQFHLHVGKALCVSRQESRQNTFDRVRRGGHLQYPPVSAPKQVHPLAERADVTQHVSAISEQLLTDGGQHKPASHTVKKLEAKLLL